MSARLVLAIVATVILVQRAAELRLARRNERWARARSAVEYGAAHYPAFFILHAGWMVGWIWEAWLRGPALDPSWPAWLFVFAGAEGLRYWAIVSLGTRWNTRILVVPGDARVRHGPYRYLRHPNYIAVAAELVSVPLLFGAWVTAVVATAINAALLLGIRIPAEDRALGERP